MRTRDERRALAERKHTQRKDYRTAAGLNSEAPRNHSSLETPARCSCRDCGNPRRQRKGADKLTLQERRQQAPE